MWKEFIARHNYFKIKSNRSYCKIQTCVFPAFPSIGLAGLGILNTIFHS